MDSNQICKFLLLLTLLFIGYETAYSQSCAPELSPVESWKLAYRNRGNRCEGFYRAKVSSGSIDIVGVVNGNFHFELSENEVIEVSTSFIQNQPINVRATGIPLKIYYRMDAQIAPDQKLNWAISDVIFSQKLSAKKIGVFGWIGEEADKTYVPVTAVAKIGSQAKDGKIRLYLRASVDIGDTHWRFSKVTDGACDPFGQWERVGKSYRTGQPISITLAPSKTQKLCVEVAAQEKSNARWLKRSFVVVVNQIDEN